MPIAYKNARFFFAALASMAEEFRQALLEQDDVGRRCLLTQALAQSDMVFGIWPDEEEPDGFAVQIVKGDHIMPPLVGFETDEEIVVAAIPCAGGEQATRLDKVVRDTFDVPQEQGDDLPDQPVLQTG